MHTERPLRLLGRLLIADLGTNPIRRTALNMGRPTDQTPVVVSFRAKQRLAAIYRQHKPDQPALDVGPYSRATTANETAPFAIRAAVLDEPVHASDENTAKEPQGYDGWLPRRDVHSEICVTCNTLRKLQMLHGTIVEVSQRLLGNVATPHSVSFYAKQDGVQCTCRSPVQQIAQLLCVLLG